ncbi:hypothetical protein [Desulforamulus aquiferis]|uniref:Uncharacterized protein n=1 Tax=Desulforamulus aquiferis TaxID=1397668 RepID=A0AAW7ZI50_9FIRM|nr:hypothetical protein [Desulforamulus aquiferis]MDO7788789.1 hypothetical protein [Desulforamulus aquiferis]
MKKKNYKERYEELHDLFNELLSGHRLVLESIGELRAENEILKGILHKYGIEIPAKHVDF